MRISSHNLSAALGNSHRVDQYGSSSHRKQNAHGAVQDSTIEQMSPINTVTDDNELSGGHHNNFFREEPEKGFSKQLKGLTPEQLAQASRQLLEDDKAEH